MSCVFKIKYQGEHLGIISSKVKYSEFICHSNLTILRWWFQILFYVHPNLGKMSNLTNIFQTGGSTINQMMNEWWVNDDDWMRMVLIDDSITSRIPIIHFPSASNIFQVWLCLSIPFLEGTCCLRSSTRQEFRRNIFSQETEMLFPCSKDPILFNFVNKMFDIICLYSWVCMQSMNISFVEWIYWTSCASNIAATFDSPFPLWIVSTSSWDFESKALVDSTCWNLPTLLMLRNPIPNHPGCMKPGK